jgi:hypothetical protein
MHSGEPILSFKFLQESLRPALQAKRGCYTEAIDAREKSQCPIRTP